MLAASISKGDLSDPGFECALVAILMQILVHAQECLLTQILGIFAMPDHAMDNMPAELLVLEHELLESTRPAAEDGIDEGLILFPAGRCVGHTLLDTPAA